MYILSLITLTIITISTLGIIAGSLTLNQNSQYSAESNQAVNLAEAGIDKAVASLNQSGGNYNGESETQLGEGTYEVVVTNIDAINKKIEATGYVPNKAEAKSKRTIELQISKGTGISFNYGVQVGQGGLEMSNSATVNGSVYTNGNIVMSGSSKITGDAYVAGGIAPNADQQWDCTPPNCLDYKFGQTSGSVLDVAQSFKPQTTQVINKVALKLKKNGAPPNVTVRILSDSGGNPNKNSVLASGVLNAALVSSSQYGFTEVALTTNPTLTAGTTYWIMIDTSANASNFWYWSSDSLQGYTCSATPPCLAKWSANWQAGSPVWSAISPAGDLGFKVYMGGTATYIQGSNHATILGDAHANTIRDIAIGKDAYYQIESNITASGQNCSNNTHCHPGSSDPPVTSMPISQANIDDWKAQAEAAGSLSAPDCNSATPWGPGKYTGNVNLTNNCKETVKTPIWVTGDLNLANSAELKLDTTYGATSGAIIVDNFITLSNGNKLLGSGTQGSYLIAISEFNSRDDPSQRDAIIISNSGNQGIVYSNLGSISISNSNTMTEITAWKLRLTNSVTINYDQGLAGAFFSSGPSGSFSVIKGSYQSR